MKKKESITLKTIQEKRYGHRVMLRVNSGQLWSMMIALERLTLNKNLQKQTRKLGRELYKIGKKEYGWV